MNLYEYVTRSKNNPELFWQLMAWERFNVLKEAIEMITTLENDIQELKAQRKENTITITRDKEVYCPVCQYTSKLGAFVDEISYMGETAYTRESIEVDCACPNCGATKTPMIVNP